MRAARAGHAPGTTDDHVIDLTAPDARHPGWLIASTDVGHVAAARRERPWRRAAEGQRAVPKGEKHAYLAGESFTACGVPLGYLQRWDDQAFGDGALNRCPACLEHVRAAMRSATAIRGSE